MASASAQTNEGSSSNGPQFSLTGSLRIGAAEESIAQGSGEIKYGVNCHCGKIAEYKCDSCNRAGYCGSDCQRADWRAKHKIECKVFQKENTFHEFLQFCIKKVMDEWTKKNTELPFFLVNIMGDFNGKQINFLIKITKEAFSLDSCAILHLIHSIVPRMKHDLCASLKKELETEIFDFKFFTQINVGPWATHHIRVAEGDIETMKLWIRTDD